MGSVPFPPVATGVLGGLSHTQKGTSPDLFIHNFRPYLRAFRSCSVNRSRPAGHPLRGPSEVRYAPVDHRASSDDRPLAARRREGEAPRDLARQGHTVSDAIGGTGRGCSAQSGRRDRERDRERRWPPRRPFRDSVASCCLEAERNRSARPRRLPASRSCLRHCRPPRLSSPRNASWRSLPGRRRHRA